MHSVGKICMIFVSHRIKNLNIVRYEMVEKKLSHEEKSVGLASISPCQLVISIHIKRANIVANIWRNFGIYQVEITNGCGREKWIEKEC